MRFVPCAFVPVAPATCLGPMALSRADVPGVVEGPALLDALRRGEAPPAGAVVVVLCGGEAGLECARALRRRGLAVTVVCRRAPEEPPPCAEPTELIRRGGRVRWLRLTRSRPARPADEFVLPADLVVLGAGDAGTAGPSPLIPAAR